MDSVRRKEAPVTKEPSLSQTLVDYHMYGADSDPPAGFIEEEMALERADRREERKDEARA